MIKTVLYYKIIEENPHPKPATAKRPVSPAVAFQKASQSLPPAGGKELGSFFTATCAWGKIPLRLPVWNFAALRQNYARSRLPSLWQKNRRFFASYISSYSRPYTTRGMPAGSVVISRSPKPTERISRSTSSAWPIPTSKNSIPPVRRASRHRVVTER